MKNRYKICILLLIISIFTVIYTLTNINKEEIIQEPDFLINTAKETKVEEITISPTNTVNN